MDFYYPNFQNDMWRIMGLIFYNNPLYFIKEKAFDKERITTFCKEKGIALYDTAMRIVRGSGNASDKLKYFNQILKCFNTFAWMQNGSYRTKAGETLLEVIRMVSRQVIPSGYGKLHNFSFSGKNCQIVQNAIDFQSLSHVSGKEGLILQNNHSHSIVAGGLDDISYTTRLIPFTLLMISLDTFIRKS